MSYPPEQVIADMIILIRAKERNGERERIIKLLKTLSHDYNVPARDNSGDLYHVAEFCTACTAIDLVNKSSAVNKSTNAWQASDYTKDNND